MCTQHGLLSSKFLKAAAVIMIFSSWIIYNFLYIPSCSKSFNYSKAKERLGYTPIITLEVRFFKEMSNEYFQSPLATTRHPWFSGLKSMFDHWSIEVNHCIFSKWIDSIKGFHWSITTENISKFWLIWKWPNKWHAILTFCKKKAL